MTVQAEQSLLLDHVDMRMVAADTLDPAAGRNAIVQLDPDHPGFRDAEYRARRNRIARIALEHQPGTPIPHAALEGRLALTICGDALTDFAKDHDDRTMRDAAQLSHISGM